MSDQLHDTVALVGQRGLLVLAMSVIISTGALVVVSVRNGLR